MKKLHRIVLLIPVSLCGLLAFASCEAKSSESDDDSQPLSFWAYQPSRQEDQDSFKSLMTAFTSETGIQVKLNLVVKDSYNTALNSALTSRSKPDIAYLDQPLIADFASKKKIASLDTITKGDSDFDQSRFFAGSYTTCLYQQSLYGIPLNMTSTVLFYNSDFVSKSPSTWADWLGTSVSGNHSLFDGIGTSGYAGWYFQCFLANNGGSLMNSTNTEVTFNNDKGIEAAQMIQNLYTFDNPVAVTNRNSSNAFGRGQVAYRLGSSSDIDTLDTNFPNLNYNVCLLPTKSAGDVSHSNMGGENLVVLSTSAKQASCLKLMKFLLREDNSKKVSNFTGNFPAVKDYATADSLVVVKESSRAKKEVILEQMAQAVARPVIPGWLLVNDDYLGTAIGDKILSASNASLRADISGALNTAAEAAKESLFA